MRLFAFVLSFRIVMQANMKRYACSSHTLQGFSTISSAIIINRPNEFGESSTENEDFSTSRRIQRRCRICRKKTSYFCSKCSIPSAGLYVPLCNPLKTMQPGCYFRHIENVDNNSLNQDCSDNSCSSFPNSSWDGSLVNEVPIQKKSRCEDDNMCSNSMYGFESFPLPLVQGINNNADMIQSYPPIQSVNFFSSTSLPLNDSSEKSKLTSYSEKTVPNWSRNTSYSSPPPLQIDSVISAIHSLRDGCPRSSDELDSLQSIPEVILDFIVMFIMVFLLFICFSCKYFIFVIAL